MTKVDFLFHKMGFEKRWYNRALTYEYVNNLDRIEIIFSPGGCKVNHYYNNELLPGSPPISVNMAIAIAEKLKELGLTGPNTIVGGMK